MRVCESYAPSTASLLDFCRLNGDLPSISERGPTAPGVEAMPRPSDELLAVCCAKRASDVLIKTKL